MHSVITARGLTVLVALAAVSLLVGSCCKVPEPAPVVSPVSVVIEPEEDWNPPKTQHTFIVTVFDAEGRPMPNVQVHWILARTGDAVGDIVTYDDQEFGENAWWLREMTQKSDNHYAVSYTNEEKEILHAGMRWDPDAQVRMQDFEVLPGQTWCTITSPVEGDSHMIAFVPAIENAHCHKVFAIKHWQPVPELMITKECTESVMVNDQIEYRITVKNVGMAATEDVMLHEEIPDGVSISDGTSFPMSLGVLAPDQERVVTFRATANTEGNKLNRTWAVAGPLNVAADCLTVVRQYPPELSIRKTCNPTQIGYGETVTFDITVTNTGGPATNVMVNDIVPAGLQAMGDTSWTIGEMLKGDSRSFTLQARGTQAGTFRNVAVATASNHGEVRDACDVTVILPTLRITKTCQAESPPVAANIQALNRMERATHTITVFNDGPGEAREVVVVDRIPLDSRGRERIRYVSSTPAGDYDPNSHTITWRLGTLPAGPTALNVVFEGVTVGPARNTATVTAQGLQPQSADCTLIVIGSAAFQVSLKDVLGGNLSADVFTVNQPFYYVAEIENEGDTDLWMDITFELSEQLQLGTGPLGFIPSETSTAEPSGSNVLTVDRLSDGKYRIKGFYLEMRGKPQYKRWIKIPVVGISPTRGQAATIDLKFNWRMWFEGDYVGNVGGQAAARETTTIDPE